MTNNSEKFTLLWTKAQHSVAAYISALVPDFSDAEDILQEVALVLVRRFDEYDPAQPFVAWAVGIARVHVLKHWDRRRQSPRLIDEELLERVSAIYRDKGDQFDAMRLALEHCFGKVQGRRRQALELRYGADLKPQAIADKLGMAAEAARNLLSRARNDLRTCIESRLRQSEHPT